MKHTPKSKEAEEKVGRRCSCKTEYNGNGSRAQSSGVEIKFREERKLRGQEIRTGEETAGGLAWTGGAQGCSGMRVRAEAAAGQRPFNGAGGM